MSVCPFEITRECRGLRCMLAVVVHTAGSDVTGCALAIIPAMLRPELQFNINSLPQQVEREKPIVTEPYGLGENDK